MLRAALLAGAERGINRVLRLDPTALPRLARLSGRIIEIDCTAPAWRLFILADDEGLRLASNWGADADCRLRAPASSLLRLAVSRNKTDGASRPSSVPTGTEARSGGTKARVASLPKGVTSAVIW